MSQNAQGVEHLGINVLMIYMTNILNCLKLSICTTNFWNGKLWNQYWMMSGRKVKMMGFIFMA